MRSERKGASARAAGVATAARPPSAMASPPWKFCRASALLEGRMCRSQAGDWHSIGGARDVIQPDAVTELHRLRVAAMLAADSDLERGARAAALVDRHPDETPHALLVEYLEG